MVALATLSAWTAPLLLVAAKHQQWSPDMLLLMFKLMFTTLDVWQLVLLVTGAIIASLALRWRWLIVPSAATVLISLWPAALALDALLGSGGTPCYITMPVPPATE